MHFRKLKLTNLFVASLLLIVGDTVAQTRQLAQDKQSGISVDRRFKQLDRNGDGKVTRAEAGEAAWFGRLDHNGDGVITLEEAQAAVSRMRARPSLPSAPPATVPEGINVNAKPGPPPAAPPVSKSAAFTDPAFSRDCELGTRGANGRLIGGTETMRFLQHRGNLFASTGCWMDLPYGPRPEGQPAWTGPQVLVKDSAAGTWRVDISFPTAVRVDAMISATFVTDGSGRRLESPVSLLVASPSSENTATWTRDDATGKWIESVAVEGLRGGLRSFCTHVDKVTGIQYLFGGATKSGGIFRAVYDSAAPGKLCWHKAPELSGTGRMMCMAEADGVLYAAAGIEDETPLSGGLFRRVDGEKPRWELLWRWPHLIRERGDETEILRGLTAIPDPQGGMHEVLLGTCNYPGVVYRIDPKRNFAVTTELDIRAYFAKAFGVSQLRGPCLSAYNNFLPATDPDTGEKVHLLGLWINHPDGRATENGASAWYLVRHADGTYAHGRVFDPKHPKPNPPRGLLATRTIEVSPFPQDKGRVLYFGGFDCARIESRNTAWIYKGTLPLAAQKKHGLITLKETKLAAAIDADRTQEYDWTVSEPYASVIRDGIQFNNNRWAGEQGTMFVKFGPPTVTWWTTHSGKRRDFPVSASNAAIGRNWGTQTSADIPLPAKLADIEYLRVSLIATVPTKPSHMYRVCWQTYLADNPTGRFDGDFAPTIYWQNCPDNWWGRPKGVFEIDGRKWQYNDCNQAVGRYCVPTLAPKLQPDKNGKIEMYDVDFKPLFDKAVELGFYTDQKYLMTIHASWEVWILDEDLTMNNMCFVIKVKGKPEVTVPSWSQLPSRSRSAQELPPVEHRISRLGRQRPE